VGFVVGMVCQAADASTLAVRLVGFPGSLWIRALKLMVVPMIFTSMVVSVASASTSGGSNATTVMASVAVRFYLTTTALAALTGVVFFNMFFHVFTPLANGTSSAEPTPAGGDDAAVSKSTAFDTLFSFGAALVPDNLIACFYETRSPPLDTDRSLHVPTMPRCDVRTCHLAACPTRVCRAPRAH
jgi:Na+/H+-dicarboxylate symporter